MTTELPDEKPPDSMPSSLTNTVGSGCSLVAFEGCAEGCGCLLTAAGAFAALILWSVVAFARF